MLTAMTEAAVSIRLGGACHGRPRLNFSCSLFKFLLEKRLSDCFFSSFDPPWPAGRCVLLSRIIPSMGFIERVFPRERSSFRISEGRPLNGRSLSLGLSLGRGSVFCLVLMRARVSRA